MTLCHCCCAADVDCGGRGCSASCLKGGACLMNSDCATDTCSAGVCVQPLTCSNRVKDIGEGDVDCGGFCDRQCAVSSTCGASRDCSSEVCTAGKCTDAPTCRNGRQDGQETGDGWSPTAASTHQQIKGCQLACDTATCALCSQLSSLH